MSIHQRIKQRRTDLQLSMEELAKRVDVKSWQTIQQWEKEGGTAPKRTRLAAVASALGTSVEWLLYGETPTHQAQQSAQDIKSNDFPTSGDNFGAGPALKPLAYPEISWVQAGMWTEICDSFQPGDADVWHRSTENLGQHGYVLRVSGSSMTAAPGERVTFPDGTLLFVNPEADPLPGKFVIVRRNGNEATFKKLVTIDGDLFLEALNPAWPNRYIKLIEEDHICGVVLEAKLPLY